MSIIQEKPKLVCVGENSFTYPADHHTHLMKKYFDISGFDPKKEYDRSYTFIYRYDDELKKVSRFKNKGCLFIADGLWEKTFLCDDNFNDRTLGLINNGYFDNPRVVQVPKWFWFEEHEGQKQRKMQITSWPHDHVKEKTFLMQIGVLKWPRPFIIERLQKNQLLNNSIYSVLYQGKALEGTVKGYDSKNRNIEQRNYKPEWYNKTHYTTIVESTCDHGPFITEKTFKPIMYGHPFIVIGNPGILSQLESWGFITFDKLFVKEYDSILDFDKRLNEIIRQMKQFKSQDCREAIEYNFKRFWDKALVSGLMKKELIEPILNFVLKNR
jgi:hypothetical protein